MRALVADAFPKERLGDLAALGLEVVDRPDLAAKDIPGAIAGSQILIVRGKAVGAAVFEQPSSLSLVIRAGAGVNTIDVAAASRRGVYVSNCPGQNAIAVAELAIGLALALDRKIADAVADARAGRWDKRRYSEARGLFGRTMGIVGLGAIGRETARRALGLGMRVVGWSRSLDDGRAKELGIGRAASVTEVAAESDVLSLHLPLRPETRGLVDAEVLGRLAPGALLINTARAELVDQKALREALRAGRLWAGLDVHVGEPEGGQAAWHDELVTLPNVYATHHVGASTAQAQEAIAREAVRIVATFLREGTVLNCVNLAKKTPARCQLLVRHLDKVGVLANVLDVIREAGINAQTIENRVFEEASAACCTIQLDARPPPEVLARICGRQDEILSAECFDL